MSDTVTAQPRPLAQLLRPGLVNLAVILVVGTYALPYVYLLITSLKPASEVLQIPPAFLPERISLENYRSVFDNPSVPAALFNSIQSVSTSSHLWARRPR